MATLSVRFRNLDTYDRLKARARGTSLSALAERLIEEGLRSDAHPTVVFRDGPSGRRAGLAGGPDVWEVVAVVRHQSGTAEERVAAAADVLALSPAQVRTAVRYYGEYPDEIDAFIEDNERSAERQLTAWQNEQRLLAG